MGTGSSIADSRDRLAVALEEKRRLVEQTERLVREAREQAEAAANHFRELRNGTPDWRLIWPREGPIAAMPRTFPGRREWIRLTSPLPAYRGRIAGR